ncbi:glutathione S-transferase family protein [Ahrensia kielensis]|uniref:Glutathione S-transferase family protein n=1 Tax=Ahrensia kielensis TaxID=76980 RepID=A0ABU9T4A7_9HYPH
MPIILYSPASPYSAKVRMAADYADIGIEARKVTTSDEPSDLIDANPLGKIPTLVLDDGFSVFDSRAIMQELDRLSGKTLYPRNGDKRRIAERLEAAADGLCDCLLAQIYEKRMRPEEKIHQEWIDMQARKVERSLDWLEENITPVRGKLNGGQFAVAAAMSYMDLRFPDLNWRRGRAKLRRFETRFQEAYPAFDTYKAQA